MFENIIGHERNKRFFSNLLSKDIRRLSHAYMFLGNEGVGKRTFAMEIAKGLSGMDRNIHLIEPEKGIINIDKIRQMQEEIAMPPFNGMTNKRIVVIDNADSMNESAQNALLKILEEPPTYVTIFLIVSDMAKLLSTILSRCSTLRFLPLLEDDEPILEILSPAKVDTKMISFMLVYVGNSVGRAKELVESADKLDDCKTLYTYSAKLSSLTKTNQTLYDIHKFLSSDKDKATVYLRVIINYYMNNYYNETDTNNLKISKVLAETVSNIKRGGNLSLSILTALLDVVNINKAKK